MPQTETAPDNWILRELTPDELQYLSVQALRRGIPRRMLVQKMVKTIARDKMVRAVLDDDA